MIHRYGFYRNFRALKLYRNPDPSKSRWNRLVIPTNEAAMPSWDLKLAKYAGSPFRSWGYAGGFDGVDDYVEVSDAPSLDVVSALTVEAWFNVNALDGDRTIVRKVEPYLFIIEGDKLCFQICDEENGWTVTRAEWTPSDPSAFWIGKWHHAIGSYDGSYLRLYVDGELKDEKSRTGNMPATAYNLYIGSRDGSVSFFNGTIALVRIWNRSLSDDEVQALYFDPQNPPLDGLVLWLDKDTWDWEGGKWRDKSGRGNHGVIYGVTKALPPLEAKFYEAKVVG